MISATAEDHRSIRRADLRALAKDWQNRADALEAEIPSKEGDTLAGRISMTAIALTAGGIIGALRESARRLLEALAPVRYVKCDIIDDHASIKNILPDQFIGLVLSTGGLPILVGCAREGAYGGAVSLNEVVDDRSLAAIEAGKAGPHLTRRSVLVLSPDQLRTLHADGILRYGPTTEVRLIEDVES